ncbi:hypothetical protein ANOM_004189 [Aspergillus nomiae NRRL 13137]|uniref:Tautomerase cis-CaaD-like domain-containing protein n=1 Tax=Aspergillus nomiae NRRL (strain ATCC 15546 / NRRL 13137 / CBS 260.88 / M93) TaxID=1509407 RepID=A0A0L1J589_ASPN3|nr:uncharacterized protein ANOM_004189 [Aspergillus nomiae NRRL 13137]KNG86961.1 hypothetical protein ANOM_004189 [Aspergillus nomiae NRRL 13137]
MPLYEVEHCIALSKAQRNELAQAITLLHTRKFTTPSLFVNVRFVDASNSCSYIGGKEVRYSYSPSEIHFQTLIQRAINRIIAYVRPGGNRTTADFEELAQRVTDAWNQIVVQGAECRTKESQLNRVFIMGTITAGMENGFLLPRAGEDATWLRDNAPRFEELAKQGDRDFIELVAEMESRDDLSAKTKQRMSQTNASPPTVQGPLSVVQARENPAYVPHPEEDRRTSLTQIVENSSHPPQQKPPEPRGRKPRFATLSSEVERSLSLIYRELESATLLKRQIEQLQVENSRYQQIIKIHDQDLIALRRGIGNPRVSDGELQSLKATAGQYDTVLQELNESRAENVTLAENLKAAKDETAKTNTVLDEWKGKLARLIQEWLISELKESICALPNRSPM